MDADQFRLQHPAAGERQRGEAGPPIGPFIFEVISELRAARSCDTARVTAPSGIGLVGEWRHLLGM